MLKQFIRLAAAAALALAVAACGGSSGPEFIWLRAVHAVPDGGEFRVRFENYLFDRNVTHANATSEGFESRLGRFGHSTHMTATYRFPGSATDNTLLEQEVPVEEDATTTVIFAGQFDAAEVITVVSPRLQRPLAALNVQFVHAALAFGALDVYVTAPDTNLAATAPLVSLQPRGPSAILEIPFGATRIRITPAGSLEPLMDSGELDFPEVQTASGPGMQWLFTISPSTVPGPSPLQLIGSTGRESFRFLDAGTPVTLRAVHAIQGAPAYSLFALTEPEELVYAGIEYLEIGPPVPAPVGQYALQFRPDGEGEPVSTAQGDFLLGLESLVFLSGRPGQSTVFLSPSSTRSVATEAKLRFANLAPDSKFFSIYLTATEDGELVAANRLIRDLRFANAAGHVPRTPGDYFLTFTERFFEDASEAADAEETIVFGPTPITLAGGDVFTWLLFPPESDGEPERLELLDDRLP